MRTIITAIAATLFTATINAGDVYQGLEMGNSDLDAGSTGTEVFAGVQPGVGDRIDIYNGLADGNADLFKAQSGGPSDGGDAPDIYMGLSANPDLQF